MRVFLVFCAFLTAVSCYDEANCAARRNKTYHTGICRLPHGITPVDNETIVALRLDECEHDGNHGGGKDVLYGVLVSMLAAVSFGSMFLPTKKFDTGDGMYYQWMMTIGAWLVGLMINICLTYQPPFFSLSMLSGVLWATGNIFSVPSFSLIGIGIGQTMQGNVNMIGGWISGRFILCQHIGSHLLNSIGVVFVIIGSVLLSCVKSDGKKKKRKSLCPFLDKKKRYKPNETTPLTSSASDINSSRRKRDSSADIEQSDEKKQSLKNDPALEDNGTLLKRLQSKPIGKVIGVLVAAFSGLFLGFQFLPVEFLRRCQHEAFSCTELDYAFSVFTGTLLAGTFWFVVYCVCVKFRPMINPKLTVPALISGVMFGIGNAAWLLSNQFVGMPVSFPIITAGASIVSCFWGVFVFREITGYKNLGFFLFAFLFVVAGIIFVGISFH